MIFRGFLPGSLRTIKPSLPQFKNFIFFGRPILVVHKKLGYFFGPSTQQVSLSHPLFTTPSPTANGARLGPPAQGPRVPRGLS